MLDTLNPDLPTVAIPCAPWGRPAALVLVLPPEVPGAARGLLWALWEWEKGDVRDAAIGRA